MSKGQEAIDAAFSALTENLDITPELAAACSPHELPFLPCDNQRIFVDGAIGEHFRLGILRAWANGVSEHPEFFQLEPDALEGVIEEVMGAHIHPFFEDESPLQQDELVAINGLGIFDAVRRDRSDVPFPQMLTAEQNMFGRVVGIGFGPYRDVPHLKEAVAAGPSTQVELELRTGLILGLEDATVCCREGYGPIEVTYPEVLIPLSATGLRIYKTYPE